jgi:hypothetical protein
MIGFNGVNLSLTVIIHKTHKHLNFGVSTIYLCSLVAVDTSNPFSVVIGVTTPLSKCIQGLYRRRLALLQ